MALRSVPPRSTTKAVSFSPGVDVSFCVDSKYNFKGVPRTSLAGAAGAGATVVLGPAGVEDLAGLDVDGCGDLLDRCGLGNATGVSSASHDGRESTQQGKDSKFGVEEHLEESVK